MGAVSEKVCGMGRFYMSYDVLNRLSDSWKDLRQIVVYGFGKVAQRNIDKIVRDFSVKCIVDNDPKYADGGIYEGIVIQNLQKAKEDLKNHKVIVCTSSLAYASIQQDLQSLGLKEFEDYCRLEDFMPEWYWKYRREVVISQMSSSITSRCTLNCQHCNVFMPYYKEHYDTTVEELMRDMDLLFERVDYLTSYFVFGGEPLLNKNLPEMLTGIYGKYHNRIGYMQIITNGTVVPSSELLEACKACKVKIRLSDYTRQVPYDKKLAEVKEALNKSGVDWSMGVYDTWLSLEFPAVKKVIAKNSEDAKKHMLACSQGCHMVGDGRLYYCGALCNAQRCGLWQVREGDYVDLQKSEGSLEQDKLRVLRYCLGDVDQKYISLCNVCWGAGADNPHEVVAGIQMKR